MITRRELLDLGSVCVGSRSIRLLEALNAHSIFFCNSVSIPHVGSLGCLCSDYLELCLFYTTYVLNCCIPITGCCVVFWVRFMSPSLVLPVLFFIIFFILT